MKLAGLVQAFIDEQRTICQLLEPERVLALAVAAVQFYVAYGHLDSPNVKPEEEEKPVGVFDFFAAAFSESVSVIDPLHQSVANRLIPQPTLQPLPPMPIDSITSESEVTASDWGIVRPLFMLYCEREQALLLEASRVLGVDVFGRSSGEVQQDIANYESELPQKAFIQPAFTV